MLSKVLQWVAGRKTSNKVYITRVFNFGTWPEWIDLKKEYDWQEIEEAVQQPLKGQWNRRAKNFAEVLFECQMPDEVLISYHA